MTATLSPMALYVLGRAVWAVLLLVAVTFVLYVLFFHFSNFARYFFDAR